MPGEVASDFRDTVVIFECRIRLRSFGGVASCHLGRDPSADRFPRISKYVVSCRPFALFQRLQTKSVKMCGRGAPNWSIWRSQCSSGHGPCNRPRGWPNCRPSGPGFMGAAFWGLFGKQLNFCLPCRLPEAWYLRDFSLAGRCDVFCSYSMEPKVGVSRRRDALLGKWP